jgi:hypothetical protein
MGSATAPGLLANADVYVRQTVAAEMLGITPAGVRKLIDRQLLRAVETPNFRLVRVADVERYIARRARGRLRQGPDGRFLPRAAWSVEGGGGDAR